MGSNHSVTVYGNEWYDHAAETGGGLVSFLKEFYGMDYPDAVLAQLESNGGPLPQRAACAEIHRGRKTRGSAESPAGDLVRVRKETGHAASDTRREVRGLAYYDSVYKDEELSHRAKLVYIFLKDHADKDGTC